jgi:hypothetical protein
MLQETRYDSDEMANVVYSDFLATPGMLAVSALRKITRGQILIVAGPHPPLEFSIPLRTLSPEALRHLVAQFHTACVRLAEELGAKFVAQQKWTVNPDGATTKMKFWSGKDGDKGHMNGNYGAVIARRIFRSLGLAPQVRNDRNAGRVPRSG